MSSKKGVNPSRVRVCTYVRLLEHSKIASTAKLTTTSLLPCPEMLERRQKAWYAKLTNWEKGYLAAGAIGGGIYVYAKVDWDGSQAAAEEVSSDMSYAHLKSK